MFAKSDKVGLPQLSVQFNRRDVHCLEKFNRIYLLHKYEKVVGNNNKII